jgi:putative intracellular protease/amidase
MAADRGGAGGVLADTEVVVDRDYVLAATGLLAAEHPAAAAELVRRLLAGTVTSPAG